MGGPDIITKRRLGMAKRLYEITEHLEKTQTLPDSLTWSDLRKLAKTLHKSVATAERVRSHEHKRALVERDILRGESCTDQIDREANAARISERQRFLYDRLSTAPGKANSAERATASAAYVEAALVALCPHSNAPSRGCEIASCSH